MSLDALLTAVGKYGLLPVLVIYLLYTFITFTKEVREDNKAMQERFARLSEKVADNIDKQSDQIAELTKVVAVLQTAVTTQVNTIMTYLFDSDKEDK